MKMIVGTGVLLVSLVLPVMAQAVPAKDNHSTPEQYFQQGQNHFNRGEFIQALGSWDLAASAYQAAGDHRGEARAMVRGADALIALGRYPRALMQLNDALGRAKKINDRKLLLAVTDSLGNAYALAGHVGRAETALRSSVKLAQELGDTGVLASASNNLGNIFAARNLHQQADKSYRLAQEAAERTNNSSLSARVQVNRARSLIQVRNYKQAAKLLASGYKQTGVLSSSHDKAYGLISIGRLYGKLAVAPGMAHAKYRRLAYEALDRALQEATRIGDERTRSYALGYTGELYRQALRYKDAQQLTQQAIVAAKRAGAPEALYRWQWQSGKLLRMQGEDEQAILAYRHAVVTLQGIRSDLTTGYSEKHRAFRETVGPLYFELADLLLRRSANVPDKQKVRDYLVEARDVVELFKGVELQDYFQDDCVAALKAKTTGIDQLPAKTAALYPIILPDRVELLLSLPGGMQRFTAPVAGAKLTGETRKLRHYLEKKTTHEYLPHARKLYDWLIRPIDKALADNQIDTLVVVPDTALRTVPMAALHDGKQFLVERYALATAPGLTLVDPRPLERKHTEVLVAGLTESVQGFGSLPYVGNEIKVIDKLYPKSVVLENREFVTSKVEGELQSKQFSIVHMASHAEFKKDISNTFLLTHNNKLDMNQLEKLLAPTRFRDKPVELLTLSACQTAAGDERAALGLAGVAVKAGARSALATLWLVNDPAAAQLTRDFYNHLNNSRLSKAKALQKAQVALLKDRRYWHPGYWSPFLMIGNWL